MNARRPVTGVLLAGGLASRMGGGDKPLRMIGNLSILARVAARLRTQCATLVISANGDPHRFAAFALPVLPDTAPGSAGPLAGILAAMEWAARERPDVTHIASAPADCPFLPGNLVARLHDALDAGGASIAVAASGDRVHHVVALWSVTLRDDLRQSLEIDGMHTVSQWIARHPSVTVEWETDPVDPFFNVNTPDDLREAERLALLARD